MTNGRQFDPFGEMLVLRDAMGQRFEDSVVSPARMSRHAALGVTVDLKETQDSFVVDAVVPGLKPEDVDVTIQDNLLIIRGETRQEQQGSDTQPHYHVVERRYGRFSRAVNFPTTIDADQVRATLEHGILHLEIAKAEQVKPRKITVRNSNSQHQTVDVNT